MASEAGKWKRWLMAIGIVITPFIFQTVIADKNKEFHIAGLCNRKRFQQLNQIIDGAVLTSNNENNLDCIVTFQTDSVLQKFMLRFEKLKLDCNAHLYIYDEAHAYGVYKADYSCGNNEDDVDLFVTRNTFVTLKYVTDGWVSGGNTFRLVLTAYKDAPVECRGFRCKNQLCIHEDLTCDSVNHCADNSDETSTLAYCLENDMTFNVFGVGVGIFVVIIVGTFITCFVCVSGTALFVHKCYYRRRRPLAALNSTPNYPFLPKVAEESACSAKTNSTALNSVSVFHSAAPSPPVTAINDSRRPPTIGQTATLPRSKPSNVSPVSTSSSPGGIGGERTAHRIQCATGKSVLSDDKMKTASLNRPTHKKAGGREKGEWLV